LTFFVRCLVRQKEVLERKIERERLMSPLAALSEKLLSIVLEHGRVAVREGAALTGANRNTVKDHLKRLVDGGRLRRRGRGRGTWYEKA
jgi:predicted HTH transcriptional regulator